MRIVQHVPNGYSTDVKEVRVDLSEGKANFVDYRSSIINPKTGQSILYLIVIVGVIGSFIVLKGKKKQLFVLLPLFFVGMFCVKADNDSFVITVQDKHGNCLSNVLVDVYAKPIHVEGAPAVKFSANGGKFLDGSDAIYVKLAQSEMSYDELFDSMSQEEFNEFMMNYSFVYRDSYEVNDDAEEIPDVLRNGTVINVEWIPLSEENSLITYHGNGASFTFKNKKITEVKTYWDYLNSLFGKNTLSELFKKGDSYNIGIDNNDNCSHYQSNGIKKDSSIDFSSSSDVYQCWNDNPDGIYVNGNLFIGNDTSCFSESGIYYDYNNTYDLIDYDGFSRVEIALTKEDSFVINYSELINKLVFSELSTTFVPSKDSPFGSKPIQSIEVVKDGKNILSINQNDLIELPNKMINKYSYAIQNVEKNAQLLQYFNGVQKDKCLLIHPIK